MSVIAFNHKLKVAFFTPSWGRDILEIKSLLWDEVTQDPDIIGWRWDYHSSEEEPIEGLAIIPRELIFDGLPFRPSLSVLRELVEHQ